MVQQFEARKVSTHSEAARVGKTLLPRVQHHQHNHRGLEGIAISAGARAVARVREKREVQNVLDS